MMGWLKISDWLSTGRSTFDDDDDDDGDDDDDDDDHAFAVDDGVAHDLRLAVYCTGQLTLSSGYHDDAMIRIS